MSDVKLAITIKAQTLRIQRLQARNKELTEKNRELRGRITRLEQSRDQWKHRATSYRPTVNRLRTRVQDARRSRDLWKTRALRGPRE